MNIRRGMTLLLCAALALPLMAAPPPHAPAHGYRDKDKQARKFRGYTGVEWAEDYGIREGRCNTDTVLAAVGAVGGAVIGNRAASPENRTVATIVGALAGAIIGNEVGEAIDDRDRACIGHGLEVGAIGRDVVWTNPQTRVVHTLRPVADLAGGCRRFEYRTGPRAKAVPMVACRGAAGTWTLRR